MIPTFHEIRFPTSISRGATGGPQRRTEIVVLGSGHEERNSRWRDSRRRYQAGLGITTLEHIHDVITFFEERRGRLHGFRWKDHADFRSCQPLELPQATDQRIGIGDGGASQFALIKSYGTDTTAYERRITKPLFDTVIVALDGVELVRGQDFDVDHATGVVTLTGAAPEPGAMVTAGYEFDVPARFDTDQLEINLAAFDAGQVPEIPIVEIAL